MQRLRRKTLPIWPDPMDSMGPKINTRTRKIGGSTVWFPRGPALKHFSDKIRPEVERILDNIELPEVEKLIVKLYMIGRSEQKANPIIMICCSDKATRKEAEASIRESGLLDQHEHCGFGLGSTGLPLETSFLPRPLGKAIYLDMNASAEDALKVDVYGLTEPGIGRKLGFVASSQSGRTVQYATGGPIMRLGGHLYQLTVAHVMKHNPVSQAPQEQGWDADECEFDGQSDEDDDENIILSRGSISPGESLRDTEPDSDQQLSQQSSTSSDSSSEIPDTQISESQDVSASLMSPKPVQTELEDAEWDPSTLLGSFSMPYWNFGELDYLMIKLPTEASDMSQEPNKITVDEPSKSRTIQVDDIASVRTDVTSILAITSRGPISGVIVSDSMSFKTGGSSSFQQLLTVLLSKGLREGDSGSAIINAQTGHFYGHVVLGVDGDCVAYVLPSPNIMAKITTQFLQLPSFHRVIGHERPNSAPAVPLRRAANRLETKSLSTLTSSTRLSTSDQKARPREVSVPVDDLLTLQRELAEARAAVDRLNTELRDKRSSPEGSTRNETQLDPKLLRDMKSAVSDVEFQGELNAFDQWFRAVNAGQQSVAVHTLLQNATRAQRDLLNYALCRPDFIMPLNQLMSTIPVDASGAYRGVTYTGHERPERRYQEPPYHRGPAITVDRTNQDRYARPAVHVSSRRTSRAGPDDTWRSSGRSSLSSGSQRSSGSSVFSRQTNRTSASSAQSDVVTYRSYIEPEYGLNATRPTVYIPRQGGSPPIVREHGQAYRAAAHLEPFELMPNSHEAIRRQQEFDSHLQGRFSGTKQEDGRATRAGGASRASVEVLWDSESEHEPRSSSA